MSSTTWQTYQPGNGGRERAVKRVWSTGIRTQPLGKSETNQMRQKTANLVTFLCSVVHFLASQVA